MKRGLYSQRETREVGAEKTRQEASALKIKVRKQHERQQIVPSSSAEAAPGRIWEAAAMELGKEHCTFAYTSKPYFLEHLHFRHRAGTPPKSASGFILM